MIWILYIGTINGYNNLITIATDDLQLGHNDTINEEQQIQQNQFDSPPDDFELVPDDPPLQPIKEALQLYKKKQIIKLYKKNLQEEAMQVQQERSYARRTYKRTKKSFKKNLCKFNYKEAIQDEPINKTSTRRTKRSLHTKRTNYFLRFLVLLLDLL